MDRSNTRRTGVCISFQEMMLFTFLNSTILNSILNYICKEISASHFNIDYLLTPQISASFSCVILYVFRSSIILSDNFIHYSSHNYCLHYTEYLFRLPLAEKCFFAPKSYFVFLLIEPV